ncbi:acyl-CoA dehydrogenase family protein [Mycolicibacterium arabiense]|uniref:acyl-CoA dehydrogenase family protein n=1 Tax=Mycolicibacterium arabiense TaxID=1286181 RepID=UPI0013D44020|nr:acyl-CoA dehydrogenase family protein [Mycolicibacterium arabiense]MCV7376944.1 acyl-CoA dehydrogenase family protein [Mycolicibacterium arabiense]
MAGTTERPERPEQTSEGLVAVASGLVPLLRGNAARIEADRRIPDEVIGALEDAGLFRLMQPMRHGGLEETFETKLAVMRELGRGDGATAWVASLMSGAAWFAGMCGDELQDEIWDADPHARIAGVTAPSGAVVPADGGYRLTGRWGYCSGIWHAQWLFLGAGAPRGRDQPGLAVLPVAEVSIEDTWHVAGMRGTGSNTVVADDVFIPSHRFIPMSMLMSGRLAASSPRGAVYRVPFATAAPTDLVGPQLGLAAAAWELVRDGLDGKSITGTIYQRAVDATTTQVAMADAAQHIDLAETLAVGVVRAVDEAGATTTTPSPLERARLKMHTAEAIVHAREAVRILMTVQGSGSFAESNPLQRIWRDSEVASRHAVTNPAVAAEVYGRALLGIDEPITPMV